MGFVSKSIKVPVTIEVEHVQITSNIECVSISCCSDENARIQLENGVVVEVSEDHAIYSAVCLEFDRQTEENDFDRRVTEIVRREIGRGVKWNLKCWECGHKETRRHNSDLSCPNCGNRMIIRSTKQLD